jgi:hypothetical protein
MPKQKTFGLLFLASLLLLSAIALNAVQAQSQATVTVLDTSGGTIDPAPGTYTYADGTNVSFTATPAVTEVNFAYWMISTSDGSRTSTDNPLSFSVVGGSTYTIQAIFQVSIAVSQAPPVSMANDAIIVVASATGGTTIPAAGRYALANATSLQLTAMPNNGWNFSHWIITGNITSHGGSPLNLQPTDNPYNVNHGYGQTYTYTPVFVQSNASPSPTVPEFSGWILIALIVAALPLALLVKRTKKKSS